MTVSSIRVVFLTIGQLPLSLRKSDTRPPSRLHLAQLMVGAHASGHLLLIQLHGVAPPKTLMVTLDFIPILEIQLPRPKRMFKDTTLLLATL
jgi:hypothetical protein